jgi:hypothetical protein
VRPRAAVLLGVWLVSSAAAAGDIEPPPPREPDFESIPAPSTPGNLEPTARKVVAVSLEGIPVESIPEPFDDEPRPARVAPEAAAPDLKIGTENRREWAQWIAKRTPTSIEIRPQGAGAHTLSWVAHGTTGGSAGLLSASCAKGAAVVGLRWETFRIGPDGKGALEVRDGWFDGGTCTASMVRRTTVRVASIAQERGLPLLFAVRGQQSLTLMLPPGANVAVTDVGNAARGVKGPVERITLPLARGSSASLAATLREVSVTAWLKQVAGGDSSTPTPSPEGAREISLGIDAVQAVGEKSPTILLSTQSVGPAEMAQAKAKMRRPSKKVVRLRDVTKD